MLTAKLGASRQPSREPVLSGPAQALKLKSYLDALAAGHGDLQARIQKLTHKVTSKYKRVRLHANYIRFRGHEPTIHEFVDVLSKKLALFCLHRKYVSDTQEKWTGLSANKVLESAIDLHKKAVDLFIKANKNTNRNGEFGELITFLLIETALKAPQLVAKMSLKTSPQMPVHGSDGIHVAYDAKKKALRLYWGEAKCYDGINAALASAVQSIKENLDGKKMGHELFLVEQYFDLSGLPTEFKDTILSFLDPYDPNYNLRIDVSVMFVCFDFPGFANLNTIDPNDVEDKFVSRLRLALPLYARKLDEELKKKDIDHHEVEIFFLPVPSVADFRDKFQEEIGWKV